MKTWELAGQSRSSCSCSQPIQRGTADSRMQSMIKPRLRGVFRVPTSPLIMSLANIKPCLLIVNNSNCSTITQLIIFGMDPATAIGVASAAISFLDLTIALCKLASQVSSSANGATKHNAELENELNAFRKRTKDISSLRIGQPLKDTIDESITVSGELLALLERIRTARDDGRFGTARAVYLTVKHRDDVLVLQRGVEKCQSSLLEGLTHETL
jgi:hypothetical protein